MTTETPGTGTTQNTGTETTAAPASAATAATTTTAPASGTSSTEGTTATSAATESANKGTEPNADATTTEGGNATETKVEGEGKGTQPGAPEKYEFKAPEGHQLDDGFVSAYSEAARELNLSQDAAQQFIDRMIPEMQKRSAERIAEVRSGWEESARTDKEFGGEKFNENLAIAKRAQDAFGSPALKQLLEETGLGSHPEVIRMLFKAGKSISEDTFVSAGSGAPSTESRSQAQKLYPDQA